MPVDMDREDVLKLRYAALPDDGVIYGTMYGMDHHKDEIMGIPKRDLFVAQQSQDSLIYIWGMPGPDYNRYFFKDYGKTWAFSMEDFTD